MHRSPHLARGPTVSGQFSEVALDCKGLAIDAYLVAGIGELHLGEPARKRGKVIRQLW